MIEFVFVEFLLIDHLWVVIGLCHGRRHRCVRLHHRRCGHRRRQSFSCCCFPGSCWPVRHFRWTRFLRRRSCWRSSRKRRSGHQCCRCSGGCWAVCWDGLRRRSRPRHHRAFLLHQRHRSLQRQRLQHRHCHQHHPLDRSLPSRLRWRHHCHHYRHYLLCPRFRLCLQFPHRLQQYHRHRSSPQRRHCHQQLQYRSAD